MLSRAREILCQLRLGFDQPALAGAPWQVLQVREMFLVFKPCTAQTVLVGQQSHRSKRCMYWHEPLVVGERGRRWAWVHVCIIYENFCVLVSRLSDACLRNISPLQCLE